LIGWSLAIAGASTGKYRVADLMGAWPALVCGLAGVVVLQVVLLLWERAGGRYSLEWILVRLTQSVAGR